MAVGGTAAGEMGRGASEASAVVRGGIGLLGVAKRPQEEEEQIRKGSTEPMGGAT